MDDKLKLNIIIIIKKEQLKIMDILEDDYPQNNQYLNYEDELSQADNDTKELIKQIEKKSKYFTKIAKSEDELLNLFKDFFKEINPYMDKITMQYKNFKKDKISNSKIFQHHITILIIQDILNDYINFLVKLESSVLGLYNKKVVFKIDVKEEIDIIEFVQKETNQSIFMPLLLSFGAGYFVANI